MKNFGKIILVFSVFFLFTLSEVPAQRAGKGNCLCDGQGPGMGRGQGSFRRGGRKGGMLFGKIQMMKEELGLNEKQMDKIGKINLEYRKKHLEFKEKMAPLRIRLRRLLLEDKIDLGDVRSLLEKISKLRIEHRILRIQHRLDIEKQLSDSQKTKLRNFRMHCMGGKGMGRRGCGMGPGRGQGPGF